MSLPDAVTWEKLTFIERMDWAAKDVATNGIRPPMAAYIRHFVQFIINNACCGFLCVLVPLLANSHRNVQELLLNMYIKYTIWHHLIAAIGLAHEGPLTGKPGWPSNWRFRLTVGTLKLPVHSCFGTKRTNTDFVVHVLFYCASVAAVLLPVTPRVCVWAIVACDVWINISDYQQWASSVAYTYSHSLVCACFLQSDGMVAGMQIFLIIQWVSCGACKMGPWFANVFGPFLINSVWLRSASPVRHSLKKIIYKSHENFTPSCVARVLAYFFAFAELASPLLLLFQSSQIVYLGLAILLAMHCLILAAPANFDVYQWNSWFVVGAVYLFAVHHVGFDWASLRAMHPLLGSYLCLQLIITVIGHVLPDHVGHATAHRHWAGNWNFAYFVLRKDAVSKFTALRPAWETSTYMNADVMSSISSEYGMFKSVATLWLTSFNMKCLPALMQKTLGDHPASEFALLSAQRLGGMFMGDTCQEESNIVESLFALTKSLDLRMGDGFCVLTGAFPVQTWRASWSIIDLHSGAAEFGEYSVWDLMAVSSLPSAGQKLVELRCAKT